MEKACVVANGSSRILDIVGRLAAYINLLQRSDRALNDSVLLGSVWSAEFLCQAVASDRGSIFPACKSQTADRPLKELQRYPSERSEPVDQRMLDDTDGGRRLAEA